MSQILHYFSFRGSWKIPKDFMTLNCGNTRMLKNSFCIFNLGWLCIIFMFECILVKMFLSAFLFIYFSYFFFIIILVVVFKSDLFINVDCRLLWLLLFYPHYILGLNNVLRVWIVINWDNGSIRWQPENQSTTILIIDNQLFSQANVLGLHVIVKCILHIFGLLVKQNLCRLIKLNEIKKDWQINW